MHNDLASKRTHVAPARAVYIVTLCAIDVRHIAQNVMPHAPALVYTRESHENHDTSTIVCATDIIYT